MASTKAKTAQEILMNDFQTLVSDTERLLEHTATLAGDQADELREQIHESLLRARETLKLTEDTLRERGQAAVTATEDYVSANPWQSVGIAAGVGFLIDLLATRRLGAAVLGLLHSHVELFGIELQEQKARTVSLLLFAGLALVFALLLLVGLSTLVLIVFWDTYRLAAIIGLCVFYTLAAIFCALRLKAAIFDESSPFHGTLEELANDRERLLP